MTRFYSGVPTIPTEQEIDSSLIKAYCHSFELKRLEVMLLSVAAYAAALFLCSLFECGNEREVGLDRET